MANELDELSGPTNEQGRDVNVIEKQLPVKCGGGTKVFFNIICWFLLIIPGIVVLVKKKKAETYFRQLQQRIQHDASQIDNYLEQRVVILSNLASLLDKAINLDKETLVEIAKYRGGVHEESRNDVAGALDGVQRNINVALENYPDLKSHAEIADAIQQNSYLQREITAAREVYNDTVNKWNHDIQIWPINQMVAEKQGYTTRIPFTTSKEIKQQARANFFN